MARTAAVLAVAAALLAGCGKGKDDPEGDVRSAVQGYAKAFATRDYQALCDTYFDPKVVATLEASGLPCESAIRPKVSSTRNPRLLIRKVKVDGKTARVTVHTTADGEAATDDVLALVKTRGLWRITPLGTTGPEPVGP
jgi:ketosteroid isomerase-like protein